MKKNQTYKSKNYDFSNYAEEIKGDALFKINGGAEIENTIEAQSKAQEGDTVTNSRGETHVLTHDDIIWAQGIMESRGYTNPGDSSGTNETGGYNPGPTSTPQSNPDISDEIKSNPYAYAAYMAKQGQAKAEGDPDKYKGYNVLGVEMNPKDIVVDTVIDEKNASLDEIIPSNKVYQFGIGAGIFLLGGLSAEIGVVYSEKDGFDLYVTGGIGVGVGISGDLTIGASWSDLENKTLHNSTSNKAVIGAIINTTYDLNKNAKIDGIGGIGFGGGVLWTGTRTLKGSGQEIVNIVNSVSDLF